MQYPTSKVIVKIFCRYPNLSTVLNWYFMFICPFWRCFVVQSFMWSFFIVMSKPSGCMLLHLPAFHEQIHIQHFFSEGTIEPLHISVLHWLAFLDIHWTMPLWYLNANIRFGYQGQFLLQRSKRCSIARRISLFFNFFNWNDIVPIASILSMYCCWGCRTSKFVVSMRIEDLILTKDFILFFEMVWWLPNLNSKS